MVFPHLSDFTHSSRAWRRRGRSAQISLWQHVAGENGGRTIPNDATVRRLVRAGTLTGGVLDRVITLDVDPAWHQPGVAVFLQDGETLEIGAAASAGL